MRYLTTLLFAAVFLMQHITAQTTVVRSVPKDNFEPNMKGLSLTTQTMCGAGKLNV
jgi:hypothetical protein